MELTELSFLTVQSTSARSWYIVGHLDCNKKCRGSFSVPVEGALTTRVARVMTGGSTLLLFVLDLRPLRWMLVAGTMLQSRCLLRRSMRRNSGCSPCPTYELGSYRSSTRCRPPAISPITCDHNDFF